MEDYYVINNRLPRFPLRDYGKRSGSLRRDLDDRIQKWLVERYPSNLERRRACARLFRFARALGREGEVLESLGPDRFDHWARDSGDRGPDVDFSDFLACLRAGLPWFGWEGWPGPDPSST